VEVGDLVHMPGSVIPNGGSPEHPEEGTGVGLVVAMPPSEESFAFQHSRKRVHVFWLDEMEVCWEPMKWLEVLK
jgi:hypothetical protein